ncbi:MAG TPA: ATPase, T2SS/T4P/T4SS family, partial [Opitutaceae bacterium]|nr:ATPase, T2SS/T4P/T4SS family [Opitutaceae bacterium]
LVNAFCAGAGGTVVTLEKPIEVLHSGNEKTIVHQREVGRDVVSYADGLHEAMHQNPDWIVVQEIRHPAEAETALAAALSGHLVLASIHAFTAATTPQRYLSIINPTMEDVGARDALASCLEGVLLQRLVEGYEGLVPVFEIMLMRNIERRMERINAMENNLRLGNWVALRQDTEAGRRLGMCLWQDSQQERIDAGLIPAQ